MRGLSPCSSDIFAIHRGLRIHFGAVGRGLKGQVIAKADDQVRVAMFRILQFLNLLFFDPELICQFVYGNLFQVYLLENADRKVAYVAFLIEKALEFFITKFRFY